MLRLIFDSKNSSKLPSMVLGRIFFTKTYKSAEKFPQQIAEDLTLVYVCSLEGRMEGTSVDFVRKIVVS